MDESLTQDERRVLTAISRRSPFPDALIAQVGAARISSRRWTGVGCYTELVVPNEVPPLPIKAANQYTVTGRMGGRLCFFILFLTDDRRYIQLLEICTSEEKLPEDARLEALDEANPDAEQVAIADAARKGGFYATLRTTRGLWPPEVINSSEAASYDMADTRFGRSFASGGSIAMY